MKKLLLIFILIVGFSQINLAQSIPTNGLVAYYPFNGNANDESGFGNNGVVFGPTLTTNRFNQINSAYLFNGVSDYIETQSVFNKIVGERSRTVSFWLKTNKVARQCALVWGNQVNCYQKYNVGVSNASTSSVSVINGCGNKDNPASVLDNVWHHIVFVVDSASGANIANVKFFVDGADVTAAGSGSAMLNTFATQASKIIFGADGGSDRLSGSLDEVMIWDRALTTQEVQTVYSYIPAPTGASEQILCASSTVNDLLATGTAIKWYADASGGTALASTTVLVNETIYYASQTINGVESTDRLAVSALLPQATITASGSTSICQGSNVVLTASTGSSYLWKNGTTTVGTTQSIAVTASGSYSVAITVGTGCTVTSDATVVTVSGGSSSAVTISASGSTNFCTGGSVTLTPSITGTSYLWSNGATTPSLVVTTAGTYYVKVTNASGCSSTSYSRTITVSAMPIISGLSTVKTANTITLTGNGTPATSNAWRSSNANATISNTGVVTGVTAGTAIITYTNSTGCQQTKTITIENTTLPVGLLSFTTKSQNNSVFINWSTSSELNNSHFILSHATDGVNFSLLNKMPASVNGNIRNNYSFAHLSPANGANYYHLEQVDLDGTVRDLGIKAINFSLVQTQKVVIYPNPTPNEVKVSFDKDFYTTAKLMDLQGKILQKKIISSNETELTFDLKSLDTGNYLIQLDGKGMNVQKVVKQ